MCVHIMKKKSKEWSGFDRQDNVMKINLTLSLKRKVKVYNQCILPVLISLPLSLTASDLNRI